MARTHSPLRYPGGKACLLPLLVSILKANNLELCDYAEPYAGGCGLALGLLYGGYVQDIHINDLDPGVWSFWKSVLDHPDELCALIEETPVTIDEWHRQREIQVACDAENPIALGFAMFFLNRTNRSGIIRQAGVIGGLDQSGPYKMDCRFNRQDLVHRIKRIQRYRSRIHLSNLDALQFMRQSSTTPEDTFYCIDPPYYNKGADLYTSFYTPEDHASVASAVLQLDRPWIVTYDNTEPVSKLYRDRRQFVFDITYSLQVKRVGTELLIASKGLTLTQEIRARQTHRPQYRAA